MEQVNSSSENELGPSVLSLHSSKDLDSYKSISTDKDLILFGDWIVEGGISAKSLTCYGNLDSGDVTVLECIKVHGYLDSTGNVTSGADIQVTKSIAVKGTMSAGGDILTYEDIFVGVGVSAQGYRIIAGLREGSPGINAQIEGRNGKGIFIGVVTRPLKEKYESLRESSNLEG